MAFTLCEISTTEYWFTIERALELIVLYRVTCYYGQIMRYLRYHNKNMCNIYCKYSFLLLYVYKCILLDMFSRFFSQFRRVIPLPKPIKRTLRKAASSAKYSWQTSTPTSPCSHYAPPPPPPSPRMNGRSGKDSRRKSHLRPQRDPKGTREGGGGGQDWEGKPSCLTNPRH